MIRFWDFQLTVAPPLLSWVVRRGRRFEACSDGLVPEGKGVRFITLGRRCMHGS